MHKLRDCRSTKNFKRNKTIEQQGSAFVIHVCSMIFMLSNLLKGRLLIHIHVHVPVFLCNSIHVFYITSIKS